MASVFSEKAPRTLPQAMRSLPMLVCLLLLLSCADGGRMRRDLDALEARNQSDSLLTDSALALRLVDYFDRHGTPNERLHAHYLLARTWADLGQSPRALDEFHRAAEQADTTNLDSMGCHYLSRIYGQMGELLMVHQLPYNALKAFDEAYHYSSSCGEKRAAISFYLQKGRCYYALNTEDSTAVVNERTAKMAYELGDTLMGNTCLGPLAFIYMKRQQYAKAKICLDKYEFHSYLTPQTMQFSENWKLLYFYKAFYYMHTGQKDSSLFYYRKTLHDSNSLNNVGLTYHGMYQLFHRLQIPDSISKYSVLYAEAVDSSNRQSTSAALLSMHYLYDYNRIQSEAERVEAEFDRAKLLSTLLVMTIVLIVVISVTLFLRLRARHATIVQRINTKYVTDMLQYNYIVSELQRQKTMNTEQKRTLELRLQELRQNIAEMQDDHYAPEQWDLSVQLLNSSIVAQFHQNAAQGKTVSDEAWVALRQECNNKMPAFMQTLENMTYQPDLLETQICILTKLRFILSEINTILNISPSVLSQRRKRLYNKMTGKTGNTSDFDFYIRNMA